jgi:hypothetical protein
MNLTSSIICFDVVILCEAYSYEDCFLIVNVPQPLALLSVVGNQYHSQSSTLMLLVFFLFCVVLQFVRGIVFLQNAKECWCFVQGAVL